LVFTLIRNETGGTVNVGFFTGLIDKFIPFVLIALNKVLNEGFNLPNIAGFQLYNG